jgi:alpha-L-arabinofuranosidase
LRLLRTVTCGVGIVAGMAGLVAAAEAPEATLTIDLAKTRPAISKYVYGQFIEHLGRCIYGGLWAEMLEDRKFFYPVDGEAPAWGLFQPSARSWDGEGHPYELLLRSPWMIVGARSAVTMGKDKPWVGEHTPVITADGKGTGLVQERLGLVAGRRYVGRVVLAGTAAAAPIRVSLVWGAGASDRQTVTVERLTDEFATVSLAFTAQGSTDNGRLEIVSYGTGAFKIGTASLMPADNIYGWRADTLARLRELNSPVYRWPGGNFVSGYDWRDGIGDPDRRPPRKNPAWKGIEANDVGIDEFMVLVREIDTEAFIAVNTGLGGAEAAGAELEYVNGAATTKEGRLRADNGHAKPYGVKFWGIGNEMYGEWQLGHMPLAEYLKKHNRVVDAMRAVDPSIVAIGVGAVGDWSKAMLTNSMNHMTLLSEHTYWQSKPEVPAHVEQPTAAIRKIADAHRAYRRDLPSLKGKDIKIALDEWNYWYGANEYGELGTQYFLQDGLGAAAALHELFRNSDIFFMANYAQTVNVIGAIKTTKTEAELETTGLVLKLYRERFGVTPVEVGQDLRPLDVSAALTADGRALTVAVVNPTDETRRLRFQLAGGRALTGSGQKWAITGEGRFSHNRPGAARQVDIHTEALTQGAEAATVAPLSVTLYSLWLK